ncbi:MAG TPA: hypothetical protein DDX68_20145, partial [Clostridium sp.]|nr:hypothetical protein [Clostridium sp.]
MAHESFEDQEAG